MEIMKQFVVTEYNQESYHYYYHSSITHDSLKMLLLNKRKETLKIKVATY